MEDQIITIKGLKKTYGKKGSGNEVLKGIDLVINSGQIIGYIGPNGAGKSTTVRSFVGFFPIMKGR